MYYHHLCNSNFIPKITTISKAGRGYRATVINEKTNFNKSFTFSELASLLGSLKHGYRISKEIFDYVNTNAVYGNIVLCKIKVDIDRGYCKVE